MSTLDCATGFYIKDCIKKKKVTIKSKNVTGHCRQCRKIFVRDIMLSYVPLNLFLKLGTAHCNYFCCISSGTTKNPAKVPNFDHSVHSE